MAYQAVFTRHELKYLLTGEQKQRLMAAISPYMALDRYGKTTIRNLYFDTDNYRLIRRSIEKPAYKEKLRIRSYCQAAADSDVFVELKKKYQGVVYKRRLKLPEQDAVRWLSGSADWEAPSQISREIDYFRRHYHPLLPTVFLSYDREAYYCRAGGDLRITFDDNILVRQGDLSLESPIYGTPILPSGLTLMEIKTAGAIPLWLTAFLSEEKLYKTSFSKYGTAYQTLIFPNCTGGNVYAGNHLSGAF